MVRPTIPPFPTLPRLLLLLLLPLLVHPTEVRAMNENCGQLCSFRLCDTRDLTTSNFGRQVLQRPGGFVSKGPLVCRFAGDRRMGFVMETGEAIIERGDDSIEISRWAGQDGLLSPTFSPDFFATAPVEGATKSAIVNRGVQGNQNENLDKVCIRLPVLRYQLINPTSGAVVNMKRTGGRRSDCVAFRTTTTNLLIELSWIGRDDFDITVREPGGFVIDKFNILSPFYGALNGDAGRLGCFSANQNVNNDAVKYKLSRKVPPQSGVYTVTIDKISNCDEGFEAPYTVVVSAASVIIKSVSGTTSKNPSVDFEPVKVFRFTYNGV